MPKKALFKRYGELINAAYDWIAPKDYQVVTELPDRLGWILHRGEEVVVVVRGTATAHDVIRDCEMHMTHTAIGRIHSGFLADATKLNPVVFETLNAMPPTVDITFIGHSLGAAIVTILAVDYAISCPSTRSENMTVCTYASPKVGDSTFIKSYNDNVSHTHRFVNNLDLVPVMPIGFQYEHVTSDYRFHAGKLGDILGNHSILLYTDQVEQHQFV